MFSQNAGFSSEAVFKHDDSNIVFRRNKDGSVLLTQLNNDNKFYKINGVAADLWVKLDGTKNLGEIMHDLLTEYEVTPEQLYSDSEVAIRELLKLEFLIKVS